MAKAGRLGLVRDLLDTLMVDRNDRPIGCVDSVVLQIRSDRPPEVVAIEAGVFPLLRRLHPAVARWTRWMARRWLGLRLTSVRLPVQLVRDIGVDVELDKDADSDPKLLRIEKWLRRRIIQRIPGGSR